MTKKFAVIENGKVINIALSETPLESNWVESEVARIGDDYVNGEFIEPEPLPPEVPSIVTMRQARLALFKANLLNNVDTAIANIADEAVRKEVEIEWEYSTAVERNRHWVITLGTELGLSSEDLDNLFIEANTL